MRQLKKYKEKLGLKEPISSAYCSRTNINYYIYNTKNGLIILTVFQKSNFQLFKATPFVKMDDVIKWIEN